ncbi:MAG: topoisomerase IV, partial [Clostridiales bacterium]|nr:topoisomerase IV [Clostridiales bacterium]
LDAYIEGSGIVAEESITFTLEKNYMPYAMSVIVSRALPEIDGFKPSHRKLLYTMNKMGLLNGPRTKSANIVGQTMRLNPHGDAAIYETMVRLARGNESLLHPYVDSKGNFGKAYSRDMAYAASRYTEAKLDPICGELFRDIDKDTVDFAPNYDNTTTEPLLLPTTFPSILVNANVGIAVSMASSVCPFNLKEVCETAIALMKNPEHDAITTLKAPDFPGGGYILYDESELEKIYKTGRGSIKVRGRYTYDKSANCIDITEIPPTTTVEAIMDKIVEHIKGGRIREISDMRDETDLSGLKLTIDLKRGVNPDKLMQKLYRMTPLQDNFSCNFNILIDGSPKVMGIYEILEEWTDFRIGCVQRRVKFDLDKKSEKLHLLRGLQKILLDIDKAIKVVRETKEEKEVVPNLMIEFGIDEVQAEFVAEIRLRHLNREYILKRTNEIDDLVKEIAEMEGILASKRKVKAIIIAELKETAKKFGNPRKTKLDYEAVEIEEEAQEEIPNYPAHLIISREGYFKKIIPQSLRMSSDHNLKDGDSIELSIEGSNHHELLFFTDKQQVYKSRASDFEDTKASLLGEYIPAKLGFDEGENVHTMVVTLDYSEELLFFFENGKATKVSLKQYETKTRRRKLSNAYTDRSPLVAIFTLNEDREFALLSSDNRMLIFNSALILSKASRNAIGVNAMTLKKKAKLSSVYEFSDDLVKNPARYRVKTLPATGSIARDFTEPDQMSLI